jgi:nucleotide-binding universal stress UspA family protein
LRLAAQLGARAATRVQVLGVATPIPPNVSVIVSMRQPVSIDEQNRRAMLERVRRSVRSLVVSNRWVERVVVGMPVDVILETAARWKASMILLGIGRHTRLDRIFGAETAVAVMRSARVPVLAVAAQARSLPARAVAAVDFTPASLAAARLAAKLVATDGTLFVAHASAFRAVDAQPGGLADIYCAGARAKLDKVVRELRRRTNRRVESVMLEGEPGEALVKYARREHCDLIALGGHEQGLMDRILLGSVRTRVVRDAPCSVLIAPPDPRS